MEQLVAEMCRAVGAYGHEDIFNWFGPPTHGRQIHERIRPLQKKLHKKLFRLLVRNGSGAALFLSGRLHSGEVGMDDLKPFRLKASDRLEIRESGGRMSLLGIPLLAVGIFLTLIGVGTVPLHTAAEVPILAWQAISLAGLVFALFGCSLLFGRCRTVLDARRSGISKQWGFFLPLRRKELTLRDYNSVVLQHDAGDSDEGAGFRVVLKAQNGIEDLALYSSRDYVGSRERAAYIARFLGFPLKDQSVDHDSTLPPCGP